MERYSRFGLDENYGQYKENRAKLNQPENEAFTNLKLKIRWVITMNRMKFITKEDPTSECCMNKILCYGKNIKRYINGFMEIFQMIFFYNSMAVIVS
jgi:hypothetical protein